jgi:hypothetical protein
LSLSGGRPRLGDFRHASFWIDHQPKGETLSRAGPCRWRYAVDGRKDSAIAKRRRQRGGFAGLALELKLNQAIQRNRDDRLALDIDARFADVARDNAGEPRDATLVFPREARSQTHRAAFGGAVMFGRVTSGRLISPARLHGRPPGLISVRLLCYQVLDREQFCKAVTCLNDLTCVGTDIYMKAPGVDAWETVILSIHSGSQLDTLYSVIQHPLRIQIVFPTRVGVVLDKVPGV